MSVPTASPPSRGVSLPCLSGADAASAGETGLAAEAEPPTATPAPTPGPAGPSEPSGIVIVDIIDATGRLPGSIDLRWLGQLAGRAGAMLDASGEVRVRIVTDSEMAEAHQRFANVPGTTDVLTFDLRQDASPSAPLDTDLLICLDEAVRQATARRHEPAKELLLYIIHGMLHCLGHDDHDDAAAKRMHAREDEVLIALGVGPVYSATGDADRDGGAA